MCTGRHNDSLREGALHRNNGHDGRDFCQMSSGSPCVSETVCQLASWHRSSACTVWMSADHLHWHAVLETPFSLFSGVIVQDCPESNFSEHADVIGVPNFVISTYIACNTFYWTKLHGHYCTAPVLRCRLHFRFFFQQIRPLSPVFYPGTFWGEISPQTSNFPPRTWGEVCYYVNVILVSLLSDQN